MWPATFGSRLPSGTPPLKGTRRLTQRRKRAEAVLEAFIAPLPPRDIAFEEREVCSHIARLDSSAPRFVRPRTLGRRPRSDRHRWRCALGWPSSRPKRCGPVPGPGTGLSATKHQNRSCSASSRASCSSSANLANIAGAAFQATRFFVFAEEPLRSVAAYCLFTVFVLTFALKQPASKAGWQVRILSQQPTEGRHPLSVAWASTR
jgi:hypothetical protein